MAKDYSVYTRIIVLLIASAPTGEVEHIDKVSSFIRRVSCLLRPRVQRCWGRGV